MHRTGSLQADRAELLTCEGKLLVGAYLAIGPVEAQGHTEFGQ